MLAAFIQNWVAKRRPIGKELLITGKRVYILPTKQGIAFLVMLLIILLVGINYQNNLAYGLCFTLGAVMFLSIIHTWRNLVGVRVMNMGAEAVFAEDMACFRIRLEAVQRCRQSIAIGWADEQNNRQLTDIELLSGAEILLSKEASKRGIFSPGSVYLETQFPLGLFVAWAEVNLLLNVIVYPKPVEGILPIVAKGDDDEEGMHSAGRGVEDFQGLRTYQAGDSKKLISWKSFSKGQGLFVKDFAALLGKDPWLDFDSVSGDTEYRLAVLCYWVLKMAQENRPYGIKVASIELKPSIGNKHKTAALYALAMYGISR